MSSKEEADAELPKSYQEATAEYFKCRQLDRCIDSALRVPLAIYKVSFPLGPVDIEALPRFIAQILHIFKMAKMPNIRRTRLQVISEGIAALWKSGTELQWQTWENRSQVTMFVQESLAELFPEDDCDYDAYCEDMYMILAVLNGFMHSGDWTVANIGWMLVWRHYTIRRCFHRLPRERLLDAWVCPKVLQAARKNAQQNGMLPTQPLRRSKAIASQPLRIGPKNSFKKYGKRRKSHRGYGRGKSTHMQRCDK